MDIRKQTEDQQTREHSEACQPFFDIEKELALLLWTPEKIESAEAEEEMEEEREHHRLECTWYAGERA